MLIRDRISFDQPHCERGGIRMRVNQKALKKLTGRTIYVINNKGVRLAGKLVKANSKKLYLQPTRIGNKSVKTSAIIPLVLFDLLAVGTAPYGYGGFGDYGGYGGYGGYGYSAGYPSIGYGGYPGYY
jgi:hypothetical protein